MENNDEQSINNNLKSAYSLLEMEEAKDDPRVQKGLDKFVNGFSKSDKRLYEIEKKLAKVLDLPFIYEKYEKYYN